jgi:hypothetical protein
LVDEAMEMLFSLAGHFGGSTGAWPIQQALRTLAGEALDPFAEGRIGKVEQRGDGIDVVAHADLTDSLRAAKDSGFFRLLEHGLQRRQRISAKVAFEGTHRLAPWKRITACYTLLIGAKWLRLKFPRFC